MLSTSRNSSSDPQYSDDIQMSGEALITEFARLNLIGESPAFLECLRMIRRAAGATAPILLHGATGTGKELAARAIHYLGPRRGTPFIPVNCGAIPETLVESEFFGHEKGSFTGATGKHIGKFQEADGGTIFLDEIGELPADMQVKLLRVLQEGEVDPIGAKRPTKVDVRIISATNRNLAEEVKAGRFREDLFYRLNVFPIVAPPLRERAEDIPALIDHFIQRYNAEERRDVRGIQHEVLEVLMKQPWPGNVRQLENAIFRAVVLAENPYLAAADFPLLAQEFEEAGIDMGPPVIAQDDEAPYPAATPFSAAAAAPQASGPISVFDREGNLRTLEEIERDLIRLAIDTYEGRMSEVARRLGMGRSTLYRKIRDHGLEVKRAS